MTDDPKPLPEQLAELFTLLTAEVARIEALAGDTLTALVELRNRLERASRRSGDTTMVSPEPDDPE